MKADLIKNMELRAQWNVFLSMKHNSLAVLSDEQYAILSYTQFNCKITTEMCYAIIDNHVYCFHARTSGKKIDCNILVDKSEPESGGYLLQKKKIHKVEYYGKYIFGSDESVELVDSIQPLNIIDVKREISDLIRKEFGIVVSKEDMNKNKTRILRKLNSMPDEK